MKLSKDKASDVLKEKALLSGKCNVENCGMIGCKLNDCKKLVGGTAN
jgi:hypothetical protein